MNNTSFVIEGDVIGSIVGKNQDLSKVRMNPITQITKSAPNTNAKKTSVIEKLSWIAAIIATLIALYEFVLKK